MRIYFRFLMEELDKRGDNYRSLPLTIAIEEEEKAFPLPQASQVRDKMHAIYRCCYHINFIVSQLHQ